MGKLVAEISHSEDFAPNKGQQLKVLLVEDNPVQQMLVTHLIKQLGHQISLATDGFEALSAIQQNSTYDVILMDCQLPLMDGFQATQFIREVQKAQDKKIAIIGVSATASPDECFLAGMDDFLCKPLNKLLLKAVLGRWSRKKLD